MNLEPAPWTDNPDTFTQKAISEYNQSNPNNKVSRVLIMYKGVLEEIKQVP